MNDQNRNLTAIHTDLDAIKLYDIIEVSDIQRFQDIFAHTHGVASLITNIDGTPITEPSNFSRLCKEIIRKTEKGCANCFHSDAVIGSFNSKGPNVQRCFSGGLWDAGVSISVGGMHIANWLIGQVRNDEVDIEKMMQYADEIGVDRVVFIEALKEVPVMSKEQFHKIANLLFFYANELSDKAFKNMQLKNQLEENERINALLLEREENFGPTLQSIGDEVISMDKNGSIIKKYIALKQIQDDKVRYSKLLENLEIGIVVHAPDTSIIRSNPKACEILGLSDDQMMGKKAIDPAWCFIGEDNKIIPLEQYPVNQIANKKISIKNQIFGIHQTNSKEIVWVSVNGFPVFDNIGNITEIVVSFNDITERINVANALIESEMKYHALFENTNDVNMLIYDGKFVDCNENAFKLFGCERAELIGSSPVKFSPKFQPDGRLSEVAAEEKIRLALEGEMQRFEWDHALLNGTTFASKVQLKSLLLNGEPHLQVIIQNLEETKRSEQTISMLAHAIRSISECVSITDMEDNIIFVNNAFLNTYQYTEEELIGNNIRIIRSNNNLEEVTKEILPKTIKGGWSGELLNIKKDGTEFPVSISTSVIKDEGENPVALIGITNNITAHKRAECLLREKSEEIVNQNNILKQTNEELMMAKEKAQESDRLKSAFLANMSHEIRTPMNGILGFSELLKEPNLSGDEQQAYIDIIEKSGTRLLNIINDIVDISKIEAGLMKINLQQSNINDQQSFIYTFFKPEVEAKNIDLTYTNGLPDESAIIFTDTEKLYAILTNLVKNAIKYTEKGSIRFGYVVHNDANEPFLKFFVKDTGIGIPIERQTAVFERFVQADITDQMARQGAGLGLAISKAYVEMLGGKIWVESEEEIGSTFYFTIPF